MAKESSFEYADKNWLDHRFFGLTPEDMRVIEDQKPFRAAYVDLKVTIVARAPDLEKKLDVTRCKIVNGTRSRVRAKAKDAYAAVVAAWRAEQEMKESSEAVKAAKDAVAALKSLEGYLKTTLDDFPDNLREEAAKTLGLSDHDVISISESDYDIRLRPGLFESEEQNKKEEAVGVQDKELAKALANKKKWMICYVIWQAIADTRVLVVRPGQRVSLNKIESVGDALEEDDKSPKQARGRVYVEAKDLKFHFLKNKSGKDGGKLPGGSSPEKPLKDAIRNQTGTAYKVEVEFVKEHSEGADDDADDKKPAMKSTKPISKAPPLPPAKKLASIRKDPLQK